MTSRHQTTCIIPFWNEGRRLLYVLDEIVKVKNIDEIICVDDASKDDYSGKIKEVYPDIKVIRLDRNTGKSGAIREGLKFAVGELILLLDADLRNLDHREIEIAIEAASGDGIDMLILRRVNASLIIRLERADVLFTGERILKKGDLDVILNGSVRGWQLESAINTWMYINRKKVYWISHSGVNTHKCLKWGLLDGLRYDLKTFADMISAAGLHNFVKQFLFFGKNELKVEDKSGDHQNH